MTAGVLYIKRTFLSCIRALVLVPKCPLYRDSAVALSFIRVLLTTVKPFSPVIEGPLKYGTKVSGRTPLFRQPLGWKLLVCGHISGVN